MKSVFYYLLDFFLPQYCTGCNKKLKAGEPQICSDCLDEIFNATPERIEREFDRKFRQNGYISDFFSPYVFESEGILQNVIHSIKYNKKFLAGKLLGSKIANAAKDKLTSWEINLIIPVPLHQLKKAERGYNQSEYIAKGLSKALSTAYSGSAIKRTRFTESQTKLDMKQREINVDGAFRVKSKKKVEGKNILLVDDVITTGSTINECAKVLKENGAEKIFACSAAIAQ